MLVILIVIVILVIALAFSARERNREEIRRLHQDDLDLHKKWLEREKRKVDERCAGKPVQEQVRIREEFCARLQADMKRHQARTRELERQRKAAERAEEARREMPPGMKEAFLFMAGAAAVDSMKQKQRAGGGASCGHRDKSRGCGCTCEACLEGRHEDCYDDCDLW